MVRKKTRQRYDPYDTAILGALYRAQRPLTTRQVARKAGISWPTAQIHLKELYKMPKQPVIRNALGNKIIWRKKTEKL